MVGTIDGGARVILRENQENGEGVVIGVRLDFSKHRIGLILGAITAFRLTSLKLLIFIEKKEWHS